MAKRKRLTPAQGLGFAPSAQPMPPAAAAARPPIAQVAAEAAAHSALGEMRDEWDSARANGRLVVSLPLDAIQADHLVRDRVVQDDDAMQSLIASIAARGQQTPIEVVDLGAGRFGLIAGWRRLNALRRLHADTGEHPEVQALLRTPKDDPAAYIAMVEENEIRADLSHFERARIVLKALEAGVFDSEKAALQGLFSASSYARRSKIKSFLSVVRALDGTVPFPAAINERLGLSLAKALDTRPGFDQTLRAAMQAAAPDSIEAQTHCLTQAMAPAKSEDKTGSKSRDRVEIGALSVTQSKGKLELSGKGLTPQLVADLMAWLETQN